MARLRVVKVEFWQSERLAHALPGPDGRQARLLFIGMWNFGEDNGVVRANPVWLRGQVFPYDEDVTACDVERWLGMLEAGGFIVRYHHRGAALAWVRSFSEHQRIDKPTPPTLPLPEYSSNPPGGLDDDSPNAPRTLPEDSSPEYETNTNTSTKRDEERVPLSADADPPAATPLLRVVGKERLAPEGLQALWNSDAHPDLPRWQELNEDRRKKARTRLKERPLDGPNGWREVIRRISASSFCLGKSERGWRADPDWLLKPGTAAKVLEGKYDDRKATGPPDKRVKTHVRAEDMQHSPDVGVNDAF
jgi:hypothetical protein